MPVPVTWPFSKGQQCSPCHVTVDMCGWWLVGTDVVATCPDLAKLGWAPVQIPFFSGSVTAEEKDAEEEEEK